MRSFRSNVVMSGYWRQPDATEAVIVDGWFHTGDMATLDADGLHRSRRSKKRFDHIRRRETFHQIEIEGMLYKHPAVLEAACIAIPDEKWVTKRRLRLSSLNRG